MLIGIDAHDLEEERTGVGRYLFNLIKEWNEFEHLRVLYGGRQSPVGADLDSIQSENKSKSRVKFILYFSREIPADLKTLGPRRFEKKILRFPLGIKSNTLFVHWLLRRAAREDRVDVLFSPGYILPMFYKRPTALTIHDIVYEARPELYYWPSIWDKILLKFIAARSAKKANLILVPSEFTKNEVLKHYKVAKEKIFVVPLAAQEIFRPSKSREKLKAAKKKFWLEDKFILFVGSVFNRRRLPETIEAFKRIALQFSKCQFLIIGADRTRPALDIEGLIKETNEALGREAIIHLSRVSDKDLVYLYNAATLLVWLSDYEGFGLPIIEAMASGTPVITSRKGSLPEVAGDAALYVKDEENIEEIYRTIKRVISSELLQIQLIRRGLVRAQRFSWQKCARDTLDLLIKI